MSRQFLFLCNPKSECRCNRKGHSCLQRSRTFSDMAKKLAPYLQSEHSSFAGECTCTHCAAPDIIHRSHIAVLLGSRTRLGNGLTLCWQVAAQLDDAQLHLEAPDIATIPQVPQNQTLSLDDLFLEISWEFVTAATILSVRHWRGHCGRGYCP